MNIPLNPETRRIATVMFNEALLGLDTRERAQKFWANVAREAQGMADVIGSSLDRSHSQNHSHYESHNHAIPTSDLTEKVCI